MREWQAHKGLKLLKRKLLDFVDCHVKGQIGFEVLLVNPPRRIDRYSCFGCIELTKNNTRDDCVSIFDDVAAAARVQPSGGMDGVFFAFAGSRV